MLCQACLVADTAVKDQSLSPREQRKERLRVIQRFERMWAAACTIVMKDATIGGGLRGISYARAQQDAARINVDYEFLGSQLRYGAVGIYGPMCVELKFFTDGMVPLLLGRELGERFPHNEIVEDIVTQNGSHSISREVLVEWGDQVRLDKAPTQEGEILRQALTANASRELALRLVAGAPDAPDEDSTIHAIKRTLELKPAKTSLEEDKLHVVEGIITLEEFYRASIFAFDRLRWLASTYPGGWDISQKDTALESNLEEARSRATRFLNQVSSVYLATDKKGNQLQSAIELAQRTVLCDSSRSWCETLLDHHAKVQAGKLEGSLRKRQWLERDGPRVIVGPSRYRLMTEPKSPDEAIGHPYKISSARQYNKAGRIRP